MTKSEALEWIAKRRRQLDGYDAVVTTFYAVELLEKILVELCEG